MNFPAKYFKRSVEPIPPIEQFKMNPKVARRLTLAEIESELYSLVSDCSLTVVVHPKGYDVVRYPLCGVRYNHNDKRFEIYDDILQPRVEAVYTTVNISEAAEYLFELTEKPNR